MIFWALRRRLSVISSSLSERGRRLVTGNDGGAFLRRGARSTLASLPEFKRSKLSGDEVRGDAVFCLNHCLVKGRGEEEQGGGEVCQNEQLHGLAKKEQRHVAVITKDVIFH
ncbi:hypothetical protein PsAD26_03795 [Pseudovibrio sp. Ad26]|nr:hypothetical protein PsAD26_03795 [Pseudovibrio sp. Ad26]